MVGAGAISRREATRLCQLTTQAHNNMPKDDSTTAGNIEFHSAPMTFCSEVPRSGVDLPMNEALCLFVGH
jgi:hypothetical protein